jgi:cysteine desulfurase
MHHFDNQLGPRPSPLQEKALKEAYLAIYALAGAHHEDHFIFTSSGAEAVNHAIFSAYLDITRKTGKNHFLCGCLDEAPSIMAMSRLQELNCTFQMVPASRTGNISKEDVIHLISPRTAMLSLSWANGLTGVIQPVSEIASICHERGILFHLEMTHVLGKGDFSFHESGADLASFNGPSEGTGGLFVRSGLEISPLILGGNEQGGLRSGSFSFSSLFEMAKWAKEERARTDYYALEISRLKAMFEEKIVVSVPTSILLFQEQNRVSHLSSLIFPGAASDSLYYLLRQKGVEATFGGNHFQHFSHILKACNYLEPDCYCGMSFCFAHDIEEEDIATLVQQLSETYHQLCKYSKFLLCEKP